MASTTGTSGGGAVVRLRVLCSGCPCSYVPPLDASCVGGRCAPRGGMPNAREPEGTGSCVCRSAARPWAGSPLVGYMVPARRAEWSPWAPLGRRLAWPARPVPLVEGRSFSCGCSVRAARTATSFPWMPAASEGGAHRGAECPKPENPKGRVGVRAARRHGLGQVPLSWAAWSLSAVPSGHPGHLWVGGVAWPARPAPLVEGRSLGCGCSVRAARTATSLPWMPAASEGGVLRGAACPTPENPRERVGVRAFRRHGLGQVPLSWATRSLPAVPSGHPGHLWHLWVGGVAWPARPVPLGMDSHSAAGALFGPPVQLRPSPGCQLRLRAVRFAGRYAQRPRT